MVTQVMTDIEAMVVRWLDRHKIVYEFQTSLAGGFFEMGGAVVDFILPARLLAWRVMGEHWHEGVEVEGDDLIQRELLEGVGWTVVNIWGLDIQYRLEETMRKALLGQEMLR